MDPTDQVSKHYQAQSGAAYVASRQSVTDHLGYAINASYFSPYIQSQHRVLDFGCGNGGMLPQLQKMCAHAEGLEVNPSAREMANHRDFKIYTGLDDLPQDMRYDVVVSNHVLEHVPNVCQVLRKVRSHIVPGGLFITKLPLDDIRSKHQRTWSREDVDYHLQTWTPRLFANVLFESGYDVLTIKIITSAWHPKLFPLKKFGLDKLAFWSFAKLRHRRQLFAVARVLPESD